MDNGQVRNVIVIGGASAGYTAAIYLARATLAPLVLAGENAGGQLMFTSEVENFPGFSKGVKGPDLMDEMKKQAERFGAEIKNVNVSKVDFSGNIKKVWVGETEYQSKAVVLALGAASRMIGVGEERLLGRGVSTCAVCDAAFFKDKTTFVVGGGDAAMEEALALSKFTPKVTLIHRKDSFKASKVMQMRVLAEKKIPVMWDSDVVAVKGESKLEVIVVKNAKTREERELPADGLFLAIGHTPATEILKDRVELDSHGYLVTKMTSNKPLVNQEIWLSDYPTQTSVVGVFGAGDMVDIRYRQAVTAAGVGGMAALDVEKFLTGDISNW